MKLRYRLLLILFALLFLGVNFNRFMPAIANAAGGCPTGQRKCGNACYVPAKQCCCGTTLIPHSKKGDCDTLCKGVLKKPKK